MPPNSTFTFAGKKYERLPNDKFQKEYNQYINARNSQSRERQREFENLRMYAGVDNSQIPRTIQTFMRDEGRGTHFENFTHFGQYNFIKTKIDGIAGSIVRNPFDAKYIADSSDFNELTLALQEAYLSDKELMDWDAAFQACVTMGLVFQGCLRMGVSTEHPANPMGNIVLECMPPGSVLITDWRSGTSKGVRDLWTLSYMTAEAMKNKFHKNWGFIQQEIRLLEMLGQRHEQEEIDWNRYLPERHGDEFLVIEHNFLKKEKVKREYDPLSGVVLWEWMSDEDKRQVVESEGLSGDSFKEIEVWDDIQYIYTFAPAITTQHPLLEEKAEFQLGRLNYFPWTVGRVNGKAIPMLDQLRDAQVELNKRIATISNVAESTLTTGTLVDEAIFGMDESKKREFKKNRGNPKYLEFMQAGASRQFPNAIQNIHNAQVPPDLFNISNMMIDLMDRLVPQPAAAEGRTERSGESGVLYAQKVEVAKTMQSTMLAGIRQLINDIAESYFFMAKQLYSDGRRVFTNAQGTNETVINEVVYDIYGQEHIQNDFRLLPRHRVVISEAPAGVNNRLAQRELNNSLAQTFAQLAPNSAMVSIENIYESLEMNDIKRDELMEAVALDKERLRSQTQLEIANAQAGLQQTEQMLQQQQAQAQPMGGAEMGEGAPLPQNIQTGQPELSSGLDNPVTQERLAAGGQ